MEMRPNSQHSSRIFGLNFLACIAVIALAVAILGKAYFDFRAKEREAQEMRDALKVGSEMFKTMNDAFSRTGKEAERINQQLNSPSQQPTAPQESRPSSDPPARLPNYTRQETSVP